MIVYKGLEKHPDLAPLLIGMSISDFDRLYAKFEQTYHATTLERCATRRGERSLHRRPGGGHPYTYNLRDRLLMSLFFLRVRPTHSVLGNIYGLHRCSIAKILDDVYGTLQKSRITLVNPGQKRPKQLRSVQAVMNVYPEIQLLQDFQHPSADGGSYDVTI